LLRLARLTTHAIILMIVIALLAYSVTGANRPELMSLRLGTSSPSGSTFAQGGSIGQINVARGGTIVNPIPIPTAAAASHTPTSYTVQPDDDLAAIAGRFALTTDDLRWSNPEELTDTARVRPNQVLTVPPVAGVVVKVQKGDTLESLSQTWHVEPQSIVDFNYLRDPDREIGPGKVLVLPGAQGPRFAAEPLPRVGERSSIKVGGSPGPVGINHFPWGECTWLVASYVPITWWGDAWTWFESAKADGWAVGPVPRPGAIMVTWESRIYGHVGYVEQAYGDGSYSIIEMNYMGFGVIDRRLIRPGSVPLIGFIYPPSSTGASVSWDDREHGSSSPGGDHRLRD
jgi:LysM repeat protein